MLQPGAQAPEFSLPDADLERVDLERFNGNSHLVFYCYPKDDAPGCTLEALEFTDRQPEFAALDTQVLGIGKDSCDSHGALRDRHGIAVRLLADTAGEVCEA